jgi:hypothetical protein
VIKAPGGRREFPNEVECNTLVFVTS